MKKTTGTIIGLIFTVMFTLCGCASGDSGNNGETSSGVGGMASDIELFGETPLDAEEAASLMERYEMGTAEAEALEKLGKTESEIVDEGFRLMCSHYVEKCEQMECVHRVADAWTDFREYLSADNDFAETLGAMIAEYQTAQSGMKAIEKKYASIEALEEIGNILSYNYYVRYRLETAYDDTIVGFLEKNLAEAAPSEVYYYYANDAVYDSLINDYVSGEGEYVLMCTEPFEKGGVQNVYVSETDAVMTLESSTGFVRDVEIYECIPASQAEQMTEDYNAYYDYSWEKDEKERAVYEVLKRIASGDTQEASGTETMPRGDEKPEEIFVGTWQDIISERCNMTIIYEEPTYHIEINWSSSSRDNTRWVLEGQYDGEQGGISYCGFCMDEFVLDNGAMDVSYRYESGRGFLRVDGVGLLYWEDDEEQAGTDCIFEKTSDDVLQ